MNDLELMQTSCRILEESEELSNDLEHLVLMALGRLSISELEARIVLQEFTKEKEKKLDELSKE